MDRSTRCDSRSHDRFGTILIFDWYDGFCSGARACGHCSKKFWVALQAFDAGAHRRIYAAFAIDEAQLEQLQRLHERREWDETSIRLVLQPARTELLIEASPIDRSVQSVQQLSIEVDELITYFRDCDGAVELDVDAVVGHALRMANVADKRDPPDQ